MKYVMIVVVTAFFTWTSAWNASVNAVALECASTGQFHTKTTVYHCDKGEPL